MNMATAYMILAIAAFVVSGILFVTGIFLFIKMDVPSIIGDLSGKTAQKQIKAMRERNAESGDKRYRPGQLNEERGMLTEPVTISGRLLRKGKTGETAHPSKRLDVKGQIGETSSQNILRGEPTDELGQSEYLSCETEVLAETDATDILSDGTQVLEETSATTVLTPTDELVNSTESKEEPVSFTIMENTLSIHTDEVI